jgi:uncharacterized protein (TIGR02996 family)
MEQIVANPDDDGPRLVYADWLLERGDPRGELIRLQCDLASSATVGAAARSSADHGRLVARERELLERYEQQWVDPLEAKPLAPTFERGLLRVLHFNTGTFLRARQQAALIEHLPLLGLNRLILRGPTKRVQRLADCASLRWTPELAWFDSQLDDQGLRAMIRSPHLRQLSCLALEKLRCTDAGLAALADAEALPRLRCVKLQAPVHGGDFTAEGVLALLASERFVIDELQLTTAFRVRIEALTTGPVAAAGLSRLRKLSLRIDSDFAPIASCPHLVALRELEIDAFGCAVSDQALEALLDNPGFAELRRFSFNQPAHCPPISAAIEQRLAERFVGTETS